MGARVALKSIVTLVYLPTLYRVVGYTLFPGWSCHFRRSPIRGSEARSSKLEALNKAAVASPVFCSFIPYFRPHAFRTNSRIESNFPYLMRRVQ